MIELLNSVENRELTILNELYREFKWWSVQELADTVGYSADTIYKSIGNINSVALTEKRPYFINVKQNWGVQLVIESDITTNHISSIYIYNSLGYKILTKMFETSDLTMQKLVDDLYFSKSTVYRKLLSIKKLIEHSHLHLNMNTLEITGDEITIRHLMLTTYWQTIFYVRWPFKTVSKSLIDYRIKALSLSSNLVIEDEERLTLSILLTINFIRHQKKQYITLFDGVEMIDPIKRSIISNFEPVFSLKIPSNYLDNETAYIASFGMISRHCALTDLKVMKINNFHKQNNTLAFELYTQLIRLFNNISKNTVNIDTPLFQYQLINFFIYSIMYHNLDVEEEFNSLKLQTINENEPFFMGILNKTIDALYDLPEFKDKLIAKKATLINLYYIFAQHINFKTVIPPLQIRLIFSSNPAAEASYKRMIENKINLNLNIHTSEMPVDETFEYDLIIFDLVLSKNQAESAKYHYACPLPPTNRDWLTITNILEGISSNY